MTEFIKTILDSPSYIALIGALSFISLILQLGIALVKDVPTIFEPLSKRFGFPGLLILKDTSKSKAFQLNKLDVDITISNFSNKKETYVIKRLVLETKLIRNGMRYGILSWLQIISGLFQADADGLRAAMGDISPYRTTISLIPIHGIRPGILRTVVCWLFGIFNTIFFILVTYVYFLIILLPIPFVAFFVFHIYYPGPYRELNMESLDSAVTIKDEAGNPVSYPIIVDSGIGIRILNIRCDLTRMNTNGWDIPDNLCNGYNVLDAQLPINPCKLPKTGELAYRLKSKLVFEIHGKTKKYAIVVADDRRKSEIIYATLI
jgi:hypothetical protein